MHSLPGARAPLQRVQGTHTPCSRADIWRRCARPEKRLCCLAKCILGTNDDSGIEERSEDKGEKWIADSGVSFHITNSADLLSDVRLCDDKVSIGDKRLIDVVAYDTLTDVFPRYLTVKLLDVAYVPDVTFNLFSLVTAHKQGVRSTTEEEGLHISLFDAKFVVIRGHPGHIPGNHTCG